MAAVEAVANAVDATRKNIQADQEVIASVVNSYEAITKATAGFGEAAGKFMPKGSDFTGLFTALDEIDNNLQNMIDKIPEISELAEGSNKVKTIGELVGDDKAGEQYAALKAAYTLIEDTGGVLLDNLTVEELQVKLQETRADLATNSARDLENQRH